MKPRPSVRRRLLAMLLSVILIVWIVVVLLVFRAAKHEVDAVFDADLARSGGILQSILLHEVEEERETSRKAKDIIAELGAQRVREFPKLAAVLTQYQTESEREKLELARSAQETGQVFKTQLAFIARYADGTVMMQDHEAPEIPATRDGFQNIRLNNQTWRVYRLTDPRTGFTVQVGEKAALREQLTRHIAANSLMPLLIMLPILAVLTWIVVGNALTPLKRVANDVSRRTPDRPEPIDDADTPREISSLVTALNELFNRVQTAIERERRFSADAAHELRTPLAAIKTHLQVARLSSKDAATRDSLDQAVKGVDRATRSVEQLLLLARTDALQPRTLVLSPVNLLDVAMSVVSEFSQRAHEKNIDLGIDTSEPVWTMGNSTSLQILVRNLVGNAVHYTPEGGRVSVRAGTDGERRPWFQVSDNGPGISAEERPLVFERFHRVAGHEASDADGSGLGLSIVERIAALHGATMEVGDGLDGQGVAFKVIFVDAQ